MQSATTENRGGKKKIETTAAKYNGLPYMAAITKRHWCQIVSRKDATPPGHLRLSGHTVSMSW